MEKILTVGSSEIALATDHLLERTVMHRCLDIAVEIFDTAPIYTLSHGPGKILGAIEQRRIVSSFLSKRCTSLQDLDRHSFLFPSASRRLHVPCTTKVLWAFSRGAGHAPQHCAKTQKIVYLYDWKSLVPSLADRKAWRWKIFSPMLHHWARKNLFNASEVWVSHPVLQEQLSDFKIQSQIVAPPFELQEYPLLPTQNLPKDYLIVHTEGIDAEMAQLIVKAIVKRGLRYIFVGATPAWQKQCSAIPEHLFWGERCAGELAPLLAGARGVIDLSTDLHPHLSIKSLSCGTPTLSSHFSLPNNTFLPWQEDNIDQCIDNLLAMNGDRQFLHQSVQHYRDSYFRQRLTVKGRELGILQLPKILGPVRHDEALSSATK